MGSIGKAGNCHLERGISTSTLYKSAEYKAIIAAKNHKTTTGE